MFTAFFFFMDTPTTEIYTLSLHDALPICSPSRSRTRRLTSSTRRARLPASMSRPATRSRSEEHTSELQSRQYLVCRLLLEKKKILDRGAVGIEMQVNAPEGVTRSDDRGYE